MLNSVLYVAAAFIWGSTWLAITFQLGVVDPMVSVVYRFFLAAVILLAFCKIKRLNLRYSRRQHLQIALQGALLFGFNYWFVYLAETTLASGMVAVLFSMIVLFNIFNSALFLKTPIRKEVIIGAIIGLLGIATVFNEEIANFHFGNETAIAFLLCILSVISASLGNISSAHNQNQKLPVVQTNAFGMLYGSLIMFAIAGILQKPFIFDFSMPYVLSLLYLSVFGSIVAFGAYLTLIGHIGAERAGYISLIFPIIALGFSTVFEGYVWTLPAVIGVALILAGNFLVIRK